MAMFWSRMLVALCILSPACVWCVEPDVQNVPELIQKLKDPDPSVRGLSIQQLAKLGPEARAAILGLIEALADTESFNSEFGAIGIRRTAFQALNDVGLESVPALTLAVASPQPKLSQDAIHCLSQLGPRARSSLDAIIKVLSEPDRESHVGARAALGQIDPQGFVAIPILERFIVSPPATKEEYERCRLLELLARYPDHPRTLPLLLAALKDSNSEIRGSAVQALTRIRGHSDQIVPALLPLLRDRGLKTISEDPLHSAFLDKQCVMRLAATALAARGAPGDKVIPELLKELEHTDSKVPVESDAKAVLWQIPEFSPIPPGTAARVLRFYEQAVDKRRETIRLQKFDQFDLYTELIAIGCLARMPQQTAEFTAKWETWLKSADEY